jgi:hypothetical protein
MNTINEVTCASKVVLDKMLGKTTLIVFVTFMVLLHMHLECEVKTLHLIATIKVATHLHIIVMIVPCPRWLLHNPDVCMFSRVCRPLHDSAM